MVPNPGQPRVRQFDEARQRQAAGSSPMMPSYAVAPLPEGPIASFVPVMQHDEVPMGTPFIPPQNRTPEPIYNPEPIYTPAPVANISRSSSKKGKKEKKRSREDNPPPPIPDIQVNPPVRLHFDFFSNRAEHDRLIVGPSSQTSLSRPITAFLKSTFSRKNGRLS